MSDVNIFGISIPIIILAFLYIGLKDKFKEWTEDKDIDKRKEEEDED